MALGRSPEIPEPRLGGDLLQREDGLYNSLQSLQQPSAECPGSITRAGQAEMQSEDIFPRVCVNITKITFFSPILLPEHPQTECLGSLWVVLEFPLGSLWSSLWAPTGFCWSVLWILVRFYWISLWVPIGFC